MYVFSHYLSLVLGNKQLYFNLQKLNLVYDISLKNNKSEENLSNINDKKISQ